MYSIQKKKVCKGENESASKTRVFIYILTAYKLVGTVVVKKMRKIK